MSVAEVAAVSPLQAQRAADTEPAMESRIFLQGFPWAAYDDLTKSDRNNHVRMTYADGELEIMSPSGRHAKISQILGFMIYEWIMLHEIRADFGGDMTLKSLDSSRGLEADQCYWIANSPLVRGKDEIDLTVDPPPDLALEVEVTRPLISKLPIYQALGVTEVWHWRKNSLSVLVLDQERKYVASQESVALPGFPFSLAEDFVRQREADSSTALMMRIREAMAKLQRK
jgi:Uma2 family endonuclease